MSERLVKQPGDKQTLVRRRSGLIVAALLAMSVMSAGAAEKEIELSVVSQAVPDVFNLVATLSGVPVMVDPGVKGVVQNASYRGNAKTVYQRLAGENGLFLASNGSRFLVYPMEASVTRVIRTEYITSASIDAAMKSVFTEYPAHAVKVNEKAGVVILNGPRKFVDIGDAAIRALGGAVASVPPIVPVPEKPVPLANKPAPKVLTVVRFGVTSHNE
jgi:type II secretory pathway component GspD/PulD (secretin)